MLGENPCRRLGPQQDSRSLGGESGASGALTANMIMRTGMAFRP